MSAWTSSERFWLDVMNISLGLLVLGILAAVLGGIVLTIIRRDRDRPEGEILVREPNRTLLLPNPFSRPVRRERGASR